MGSKLSCNPSLLSLGLPGWEEVGEIEGGEDRRGVEIEGVDEEEEGEGRDNNGVGVDEREGEDKWLGANALAQNFLNCLKNFVIACSSVLYLFICHRINIIIIYNFNF